MSSLRRSSTTGSAPIRSDPIDNHEVGTPLTTFFQNLTLSPNSGASSPNTNTKQADAEHSSELAILKEVVPDLHTSVLMEILRGNDYDLEKSIDAALALYTSLSHEKGTAIIGNNANNSNSKDHVRLHNHHQVEVDHNKRTSTMKRRVSMSAAIPASTTSKPSSSPSVAAPRSRSMKLPHQKNTPSHHQQNHKQPGRGVALIIDPLKFLSCPRYRLTIDHHASSHTTFTVHFNRQYDKIGITIREHDDDIIIHHLHHNIDSIACLALDAGIHTHDIVIGINYEYFTPGVEVQDVIDILDLTGPYVTIHFTRHHHTSSSSPRIPSSSSSSKLSSLSSSSSSMISSSPPYHVCAQMVVDQGVIKADRISYISKIIIRLKDRIMNYDHLWISQRIEHWKLHPHMNDNHHHTIANMTSSSSIMASSSSFFSSMMLPSSTQSSSSYNNNHHNNMNGNTSYASDMSDITSSSSSYHNRHSTGKKATIWDPYTMFQKPALIDDHPSSSSSVHHHHDTSKTSLRPALCIRLLRAEERPNDHVILYIIWIHDVKSGAEWYVKRRFKEFFELRELLVAIRPSLSQLDFPPKRLSVGSEASLSYVYERLMMIQKFLRHVISLSSLNAYHPSSIKLQLTIQQFLDVGDHMYAIITLEKRSSYHMMLKNMIQSYVHNILQLQMMDKVLISYIENFLDDAVEDDKRGGDDWSPRIGRTVVNNMKDYMDNLQNVLYDGLSHDCIDIIRNNKYHHHHDASSSSSSGDNMIAPDHHNHLSDDEMRQVTRSAIRKQVEVEIYIPCAARLSKVLELSFHHQESILKRKIRVLLNHEQHFFGISSHHVSPSNWDDIVSQLRQLRLKSLPHDRLEALIEAAKEIPRLYQKEHPSSTSSAAASSTPLGADDFLPIFIYVLVHAEIPDILALNEELQALCDPDKRLSETGYYLATLEASLQHLMEFDEHDGVEYFFHNHHMNQKQPMNTSSYSTSMDSEDMISSSPSYHHHIPTLNSASVDSDHSALSREVVTPHRQGVDKRSSPFQYVNQTMTEIARITSGDSNDSSTIYGDLDHADSSEF